jgi:hypothetical protein
LLKRHVTRGWQDGQGLGLECGLPRWHEGLWWKQSGCTCSKGFCHGLRRCWRGGHERCAECTAGRRFANHSR